MRLLQSLPRSTVLSCALIGASTLFPFAAHAQQAPFEVAVEKSTFAEDGGPRASRVVVTRASSAGTLHLGVRVVPEDALPGRAVAVPTTLIIAEGQASAEFFVQALANTIYEGGPRRVRLEVVAGDVVVSRALTILDATPLVNLVVPRGVREGETATGQITLSKPTALRLRFSLSSNQLFVRVPSLVVIAPGQTRVSFPLAALDNRRFDGPRRAVVFLGIGGFVNAQTAAAPITVEDDESALPNFRLFVSRRVISENDGANASLGVIQLERPANAALTFNLSSFNPVPQRPNKISVPQSVTIAVGATRVTFPIAALDNDQTDGDAVAVVGVGTGNGRPAYERIVVLDDESSGPLSTVRLSTATRDNRIVRLRFSGALDAEIAADSARYEFRNRSQILAPESVSYDAATATVTLILPAEISDLESLAVVARGLRDAAGARLPTIASAVSLPLSPVRLSSIQAEVATQRVRLIFTGPLDAARATDRRAYIVAVNGGTTGFSDPTYDAATRTVSFQAQFRAGDSVSALISGLRDSQGKELAYIDSDNAIAR